MRKFSRTTDQRQSFLKSLAANLILKEKIKTTEARAKELRSIVERLVSIAKKGNLAMLIWLGKNRLGQKDKTEQDINLKEPITKVEIEIIRGKDASI